jgi:TPR repeat protein
MNAAQPPSSRFNIPLVLSIVCLTMSACADNMPVADPSANQQAQYEATANELRKSAKAGDASAQNRLGLLYCEGKGVPQNYRQGKQWFEEAAKHGHSGAQVNLGTLYLHGDGAPQSSQMALFWFRRAAEQKDALAFAKLGLMYAQGRGVLQDFIQAYMWYNLSAAQGENKSAEARDALAKQMTPAQIAEAQRLAREWKPREDKVANTPS